MKLEKFESDFMFFVFKNYGMELENFDRKICYNGKVYQVIMMNSIITFIYCITDNVTIKEIKPIC